MGNLRFALHREVVLVSYHKTVIELIECPACERKISPRASFRPGCGDPNDGSWDKESRNTEEGPLDEILGNLHPEKSPTIAISGLPEIPPVLGQDLFEYAKIGMHISPGDQPPVNDCGISLDVLNHWFNHRRPIFNPIWNLEYNRPDCCILCGKKSSP